MKLKETIIFFLLLLLFEKTISQEHKFFKGNIHSHSINSDGNSSPDQVIRWYKEHGYNFCVITDHNFLTNARALNEIFSAKGKFLVLPGEEVTDRSGGVPVHLGAINIDSLVLPENGNNVSNVIDRNATAIIHANGLPILNHPNGVLQHSIKASDILETTHLKHFEVCCADYKGGSGKPSTEVIWDSVLSSGKLIYGIAGDDAHKFEESSREPGTAWIMLRANSLVPDEIMKALKEGDFYTTTGVDIKDFSVSGNKMEIHLNSAKYGFTTFFIGKNGKILKKDESDDPAYILAPSDLYVRARIERSDGAYAWMQPVFFEKN